METNEEKMLVSTETVTNAEEPSKKKKRKKHLTETSHGDIDPVEKAKEELNAESKCDNGDEILDDKIGHEQKDANCDSTPEVDNCNNMRIRKIIWDKDTVKNIASKYVGSNVLSLPGYPCS
jgi:hypothetical protein